MRYLVTGAAGFIGSHLAEALLARGHDVVGIDCFTDYYDRRLKEENAAALPDVRRIDLSEDEIDLSGYDGVFHLAGQPGVRSFGGVFPLYVRHNVLAGQRVFEAAAAARVRVVYASTSSVYGEAGAYPTPEETPPQPVSPYGITKLTTEHLARAYGRSFGLDQVLLRYFNAYGPRQRPDMAFPRMVAALAEAESFTLFGDGGQSRSFTYVSDVVEATVAAMEQAPAGALYNVGGGEEATMNDAVATLERISGRRLEIRREPAVPGDQRRTKADTTLIRSELGWEPRVALEEGLRLTWEWATAARPRRESLR